MNFKPLAGLIFFLLLIAPALTADTEVIKLWEQNMTPHDVNSVDTDETGTYVYYGLSNGSVGAYSAAGVSQWITPLNSSVVKIKKSPASNYLVAMTSGNESVLIDTSDGSIDGTLIGVPLEDGHIRDVDIGRDGRFTFTLFDNSMYVRYLGQHYAINLTRMYGLYNSSGWLNGSYDPNGEYVLLGKTVNTTIWKWIVQKTTGWNFFPGLPADTHELRADLFPYRRDILLTEPGSGTQMFINLSEDGVTVPDSTVQLPNATLNNTAGNIVGIRLFYDNKELPANITYRPIPESVGSHFNNSMATINSTTPVGSTAAGAVERLLNGNVIAIAHYNGTMRSTTNGRFWSFVNNTFPIIGYGGSGCSFDNTMYALNASTVYKSTNSGETWYEANATGVTPGNGALCIANPVLNKLFLLTNSGRIYSTSNDDPNVWTIQNNSVAAGAATAWGGLAVNRTTGVMYGNLRNTLGYLYSSPTGQVWTIINSTLPTTADGAIVFGNGASELHLIEGSGDYRWWNSSTEGRLWSYRGRLPLTAITTFRHASQIDQNGTILVGMGGASGMMTLDQMGLAMGNTSLKQAHILKPAAGQIPVSIYYGNMSYPANASNPYVSTANASLITTSDVQMQHEHAYIKPNVSVTLYSDFRTMDIPEMGGVAAIGSTQNVTTLLIDDTGFSTGFAALANSAMQSLDIRISDGGSYLVDSRGLGIDIFQVTGALAGTYTTGGLVKESDISTKNALYIAGGGADGKLMVFSKDSTSVWQILYSGDAMAPINTVAISWRGEYAAVGRSASTLEYYNLQSAVAAAISGTQTNWYSPHQVSIKIVDFWGKQITGANIMASVNASSFPTGTDWLKSIYGINSTAANEMMNGTLLMSGRTGSDGTITFTMHSSLEYNLSISHPDLVTSVKYLYPSATSYTIYVNGVTSTIGNSTQTQLVNTSLFVTEPDINHVTFNFTYQDTSGFTQDVVWNVTCWDNRTVMYAKRWTGNVMPLVVLADNYTVPNVRGEEWRFMYNSTRSAI